MKLVVCWLMAFLVLVFVMWFGFNAGARAATRAQRDRADQSCMVHLPSANMTKRHKRWCMIRQRAMP